MTVTPSSEGSESGVWEGGLQFPSLLPDPRTASRTPFVHLGAAILTFSPRGFLEPLFTARLEEQSLPPLLPDFPPLPISGLHEMRMSMRARAHTHTHTHTHTHRHMRALKHTHPFRVWAVFVLSSGIQRCMVTILPAWSFWLCGSQQMVQRARFQRREGQCSGSALL